MRERKKGKEGEREDMKRGEEIKRTEDEGKGKGREKKMKIREKEMKMGGENGKR